MWVAIRYWILDTGYWIKDTFIGTYHPETSIQYPASSIGLYIETVSITQRSVE
jgi:hypothetical protein